MTVDRARAAVIVGDGVVARYPGLLCVARGADQEALARLLDVCASVSGPDPGRILARRLARWLGGPDAPDDDLVFGTVSAAGDQLGVFLVGAATLSIAGDPVTLSGSDAATWTDRLIAQPDTPVVLALAGAVPPAGLAGSSNDLRSGVVPGAGAVLFAGTGGLAERHLDDPHAGQRVDPEQDGRAGEESWFTDRPESVGDLIPAVRLSSGGSPPARDGVKDRVVLIPPVGGSAPATNGHAEPAAPHGDGAVHGGRHAILELGPLEMEVLAGADHGDGQGRGTDHPPDGGPDLDRGAAGPPTLPGADPGVTPSATAEPAPARPVAAASTVVSLRRTVFAESDPATPVEAAPATAALPRRIPDQRFREPGATPIDGSRLPLGRIVFDDGATFTVDAPFLVGRMPEVDPRARSGEFRSMVVDDDTGSVSRVHAEILVKGSDVVLVDSGSRNGTFVAGPDEPAWTALSPGRTSRLVPGTRVRMGSRSFVFEPGTA